MNSKIKILIGVLVVGIVLISGWWIWNSQVKPEPISGTLHLPKIPEVTISTDKTEYEQGEQIMATLSYKGGIYQWDKYAWSIQKWENDSWVTIQRRADPYFFCANTPECRDVSLEEIKECSPLVLCERPAWYEVQDTPKLTWDQSYKSEEKTFQCKFIQRLPDGRITSKETVNRTCVIFEQVPPGKYRIRFEYTTVINPDDPFSREVDIKYAEKEIVIK